MNVVKKKEMLLEKEIIKLKKENRLLKLENKSLKKSNTWLQWLVNSYKNEVKSTSQYKE